jgi:hypothetical protein
MFDVFLMPSYLDASTSSCCIRLCHAVRLSGRCDLQRHVQIAVVVQTPSPQLGVLQLSPVEVSSSFLTSLRFDLESVSVSTKIWSPHIIALVRTQGSVRDTRYINTKFHRGVTRTPDNR